MENWKDIEGYVGIYQVSNLGNIRRKPGIIRYGVNHIINNNYKYRRPSKNNTGYMVLTLHDNGTKKVVYAHRLVALAFIPNPNNFPFINHKDGDKTNNHVDNLEWCTHSMNVLHTFRVLKRGPAMGGKGKFGKLSPTAKPVLQVSKAGEVTKLWDCAADAHRALGISFQHISNSRKRNKTAGGFYWIYPEEYKQKQII